MSALHLDEIDSSEQSASSVPRRRGRLAALAVTLGLLGAAVVVPQAASAATPAATGYERSIAKSVLTVMNGERAAHHLPRLTMRLKLRHSARSHNMTMSRFNRMSHQLPREPYFASRISHAGYKWHYAGENIGWNSQMTRAGVVALEVAMYNERPPNDGHRRNILSRHYRNVGIDVYMDRAHHKVWLTTDFGAH